jgi:hypothetical protein
MIPNGCAEKPSSYDKIHSLFYPLYKGRKQDLRHGERISEPSHFIK